MDGQTDTERESVSERETGRRKDGKKGEGMTYGVCDVCRLPFSICRKSCVVCPVERIMGRCTIDVRYGQLLLLLFAVIIPFI